VGFLKKGLTGSGNSSKSWVVLGPGTRPFKRIISSTVQKMVGLVTIPPNPASEAKATFLRAFSFSCFFSIFFSKKPLRNSKPFLAVANSLNPKPKNPPDNKAILFILT
jgi:hypothetical protein